MPFKGSPTQIRPPLEFRRACWGASFSMLATPCSPLHPRHRPVSPEEQMTEWEGRRGRRTESTEAPTCASPCAGVQCLVHIEAGAGAWCLGIISTWSLALERPLSPPIWGALGHPRSEGACNSGLTNKLHPWPGSHKGWDPVSTQSAGALAPSQVPGNWEDLP